MKFYKYGIHLCDGKYKKYGGHWQWLANKLGVDYLSFGFCKWRVELCTDFYDGWHNAICFGWFQIGWGGNPAFKHDSL